MRRVFITCLLLLVAPCAAAAQQDSAQQESVELCHVYLVDVKKMEKACDALTREPAREAEELKAIKAAQTVFTPFHPTIGEEELTTKTYEFPGGGGPVITVSVFFTDESMCSSEGRDSVFLAVAVSNKRLKEAISATNNAVVEVTMNEHIDTVRVKKYMKVRGRLYLVGAQCNFKTAEGWPNGQ